MAKVYSNITHLALGCVVSGVHRPLVGQGRNGIKRAQSWTEGWGGGVGR